MLINGLKFLLQKAARIKITSSESFVYHIGKIWDTKREKVKQTEKNLIFLGLKTQKKEKVMFTVQKICLVTDLEHWSLVPSQVLAGDLHSTVFFHLLKHSCSHEELPYRDTGHPVQRIHAKKKFKSNKKWVCLLFFKCCMTGWRLMREGWRVIALTGIWAPCLWWTDWFPVGFSCSVVIILGGEKKEGRKSTVSRYLEHFLN